MGDFTADQDPGCAKSQKMCQKSAEKMLNLNLNLGFISSNQIL